MMFLSMELLADLHLTPTIRLLESKARTERLPMITPVYQHEFASVEDYLHHRPPYLMVGAVQSIRDRSIETSTHLTGDEYFLTGHFPGSPIVPGAMLQEMTTQSGGILLAARFNPMKEFNTHDPFFNEYALGVLVRVKGARFRGFARAGDTLHTHVELTDHVGEVFEFKGRILLNGKLIMSNTFTRILTMPAIPTISQPTSAFENARKKTKKATPSGNATQSVLRFFH